MGTKRFFSRRMVRLIVNFVIRLTRAVGGTNWTKTNLKLKYRVGEMAAKLLVAGITCEQIESDFLQRSL